MKGARPANKADGCPDIGPEANNRAPGAMEAGRLCLEPCAGGEPYAGGPCAGGELYSGGEPAVYVGPEGPGGTEANNRASGEMKAGRLCLNNAARVGPEGPGGMEVNNRASGEMKAGRLCHDNAVCVRPAARVGPEVLAPAGNPERLRVALRFGADAVYVGLKAMSLRNFADNFTPEELREGCDLAHSLGRRVYVTLNAFARDGELKALPSLLEQAAWAGADALIVNDPGVVRVTRRLLPDMPLHLSTQANTLNAEAAAFWGEQGIRRIVLARELSIAQMQALIQAGPPGMQYEAFVHGAMCVSYSGRCLLSAYIAGRDPNRGECAQPCRWSYALRERGPSAERGWYPVEQDGQGTYVLNSKDLRLIEHLPALVEAGLTSLKIEGRMKSIAYVATVVNAYRMALDAYARSKETGGAYALPEGLLGELDKASHRPYTTGFALGAADTQATQSADYVAGAAIGAVVLAYDGERHLATIEQRNKFQDGDTLSILSPGDIGREFVVAGIWDEAGISRASAPHPRERLVIGCAEPLRPGDILRVAPTKGHGL